MRINENSYRANFQDFLDLYDRQNTYLSTELAKYMNQPNDAANARKIAMLREQQQRANMIFSGHINQLRAEWPAVNHGPVRTPEQVQGLKMLHTILMHPDED